MDTNQSEAANLNDVYELHDSPPENTNIGDKVPIVLRKNENIGLYKFKENATKDDFLSYYYKGVTKKPIKTPKGETDDYAPQYTKHYSVSHKVCEENGWFSNKCMTTGFYFVHKKENSTEGGKRKSSKKSKKSKRKTKQKKAKKRTKRRKY